MVSAVKFVEKAVFLFAVFGISALSTACTPAPGLLVAVQPVSSFPVEALPFSLRVFLS